jgi:cation diffusion facilitator family transporter
MKNKERLLEGEKAVKVSLFGNTILAVAKFIAGFLSGSIALIGDGIHSLSDILTSFVIWVGLKIGIKPPDKEHAYGHGDAEAVAGLIVSTLLLVVAFEFGREAFSRILDPSGMVLIQYAAPIAVLSIALNLWMTYYTKDISFRINSCALEADANHHLSDAFSSVIVLVGILGSAYYAAADAIAAVIVAVYIAYIAYKVGRKNVLCLMGTVPSDSIVKDIRKAAKSVKGVIKIHTVRVRYVGFYAYVTMHVHVKKTLSLERAHKVAHEVQAEVEKIPVVKTALVHIDPA